MESSLNHVPYLENIYCLSRTYFHSCFIENFAYISFVDMERIQLEDYSV